MSKILHCSFPLLLGACFIRCRYCGDSLVQVTLPNSAVKSFVVSSQDQSLPPREVIHAHRKLHQHPIEHLERVQYISGVAAAGRLTSRFTLFAFAELSHAAPGFLFPTNEGAEQKY